MGEKNLLDSFCESIETSNDSISLNQDSLEFRICENELFVKIMRVKSSIHNAHYMKTILDGKVRLTDSHQSAP